MEKKKRLKNSRYINGFDGLRTLAVVGVILYHLLPDKMPGGYLGVPIFFVVSGYLITDLLIQEWEQNKKISLTQFYLRRMKRLYPALITMLVSATAYLTLFKRELLGNIWGVIWSSLLYVNNWWQIRFGQSYFDRFAGESPFTHIWSLAVEGQFYLFWPIIMVVFVVLIKDKKRIFQLLMVLALASGILMAVLYRPTISINRVYYGTDTRLFAVLMGTALAFIWPSTELEKRVTSKLTQRMNWSGCISFGLVLFFFLTLSGESSFTYWGGMFLFSLISTVLVASIVYPAGFIDQMFTNRLFRWIGKRSYGIYLYQFPIMIFYESWIKDLAAHPYLHALIEIILIVAVSDLSYRLIERPFLKYKMQSIWPDLQEIFKKDSIFGKKRYALVPVVIIFLIAIVGIFIAPKQPENQQDLALKDQIVANQGKAAKRNAEIQAKQKGKNQASGSSTKESEEKQAQELANYGLNTKELARAKKMKITAVGDSVLLAESEELQAIFPNMYIDATVGRQIYNSEPTFDSLITQKLMFNKVIIALGTNGYAKEEDFTKLLDKMGKRRVYLINNRVPTKRWQDANNVVIRNVAKKYKNVSVIDWFKFSNGHPEWFYNDQVHPNPDGEKYYSAFVAKQVLKG